MKKSTSILAKGKKKVEGETSASAPLLTHVLYKHQSWLADEQVSLTKQPTWLVCCLSELNYQHLAFKVIESSISWKQPYALCQHTLQHPWHQ